MSSREWFAANLHRSHRLRPAYPVERFSASGGNPATWIAVRQVEPGVRFRIGFVPPGPMPDVEEFSHAAFDTFTEGARAGKSHVRIGEIYRRALQMAKGGRA